METTLEVLTTPRGRREVHRHWTDEMKARIVSESLRPGVTVNEVADRYGMKANHLSSRRTLARQGKLLCRSRKTWSIRSHDCRAARADRRAGAAIYHIGLPRRDRGVSGHDPS